MTSANQPTDQDFELLSAYLDNELGVSQRAALEMRLASDPKLSAVLDGLHRTIQIVHSAPRITPPRNYTLDPVRYRRSASWWTRFGTLQFVGALGSAAATILIVLGFALTGLNASVPQGAPAAVNVALQPTSTLEFDNLVDKTKADTANEEPTLLLQATTAVSESSAENAAASGFAPASTQMLASPTALPTQRTAYTATQRSELPPSVGGSGGALPTQNAPNANAPDPNALSGAAQPPQPAQPSPSIADAADTAAQTGSSSSKMGVPTVFPTITHTVTDSAETDIAKATRDNEMTGVAVAPTVAAPGAEQQGQDAATSTTSKDGNVNDVQSVPTLSLPQLLIIAGTALLVFSGMLAGVGLLLARTGRNRK